MNKGGNLALNRGEHLGRMDLVAANEFGDKVSHFKVNGEEEEEGEEERERGKSRERGK
jgi:hypothetical protein